MNGVEKWCSLWRLNDSSVSYMLLLMLFAAIGCNPRGSDADTTNDDSESNRSDAASGTGESTVSQSAGAPAATQVERDSKESDTRSNDAETAPLAAAVETENPVRVVSSDGRDYFWLEMSPLEGLESRYHLRELTVNPYFEELFACGREFRKETDERAYQVVFAVEDGRRIVFNRLLQIQPGGAQKPVKPSDSKGVACLNGLYHNAVVELSGSVPLTAFQLSFSF